MPSTATTRNRLEKQAAGENSNSWGTRLNTNVIDLIDAALDGMTSVTMAGGTTTLTATDYAADQSRARYLNLTGTNGTIAIPNVEKIYLVRNAGSGDAVISTGSGTTATVKSGNTQWVACEGGNVVRAAAVTNFGSSNLATTGTLAAGATTVTGNASVSGTLAAGATTVTGALGASGDGTFNTYSILGKHPSLASGDLRMTGLLPRWLGTPDGWAGSTGSIIIGLNDAADNAGDNLGLAVPSGKAVTINVNGTNIVKATSTGAAVTGTLSCTGNATLGDASTDNHAVNGSFDILAVATSGLRVFSGGTQYFTANSNGVYFNNAGTTASAANAFLNSGDTNKILRSTSSLRYKDAIQDLSIEDARKVLSLRPITYLSKAQADDPTRRHWGCLAEDAHEQGLSCLVNYDADGAPDGFQYERTTVALIKLVADLTSRLDAAGL